MSGSARRTTRAQAVRTLREAQQAIAGGATAQPQQPIINFFPSVKSVLTRSACFLFFLGCASQADSQLTSEQKEAIQTGLGDSFALCAELAKHYGFCVAMAAFKDRFPQQINTAPSRYGYDCSGMSHPDFQGELMEKVGVDPNLRDLCRQVMTPTGPAFFNLCAKGQGGEQCRSIPKP